MKKILAALFCLSMISFANFALARDAYYLCKNGEVMVRVVPAQLRAEVIKLNGLPSYDLTCYVPNDGVNWLSCEGAEVRSFVFHVGGRSALYVGSHKTTPLSCYLASCLQTEAQ